MVRLLYFLLLAAPCSAAPKVETGELNGAQFRIEIPENWNGGLILYCHGYSAVPGTFDAKPIPGLSVFVEQGYAVAASGYAAGGWAIEEAMLDTQALHRYFAKKYGAPKETWVTGHSMGGFLTMAMLERFPNDYDGGLALCGPLSSAAAFMKRDVFDLRVVFDFYFPGALPPPDHVPADYARSAAVEAKTEALLSAAPEKAEAVRRYAAVRNNKELAAKLAFFTFILKDIQQRGGGNPFDNRDTIYEGTPDDNAVNDGVKRYAASARAAAYLRAWYTPTGRLARPMLAIHTTYDALVRPYVPNEYAMLASQNGSAAMFAQQYVKHDGHCAILPAEIARGFELLRAWARTGQRPPGGALR